MKIADLLSLFGIVVSMVAAIISVAILYQMKQDTNLARQDSELKIRPIIFIKDVIANTTDDEVQGLTIIVVNAGLGPALNVRSRVGEDIRMPGSGAIVKADVFQESSIIQVLPNASAVTGTSNNNIIVRDTAHLTFAGGNGIPDNALQSMASLQIPLARRPDGQAQLKLHALGLTKEEFENTLKDALFLTQASSMTNRLVIYKNRPKRSDTIEQVE